MKTIELKVTTGKKGEADYKEENITVEVPENLAEFVDKIGEGEVFKLAAAQFCTNAKNQHRAGMRGGSPVGVMALGKNLAARIKAAKDAGDKDTLALLSELLGTEIV